MCGNKLSSAEELGIKSNTVLLLSTSHVHSLCSHLAIYPFVLSSFGSYFYNSKKTTTECAGGEARASYKGRKVYLFACSVHNLDMKAHF